MIALAVIAGILGLALLFGAAVGGVGGMVTNSCPEQWEQSRIHYARERSEDADDAGHQSRPHGDRTADLLEQDRVDQDRIERDYLEAQHAAEVRHEHQEEDIRLAEQYSLEAST